MDIKVSQYVNQKKQIKHGESYCGAATVSMITGQPPQDVANEIGSTAPDIGLTEYLDDKGFATEKIIDGGSESTQWGFIPSPENFSKMKDVLDSGKVILYHFWGKDGRSAGHYAICKGYEGEDFIFNDPAGDRNFGYFNDKGEGAVYERSSLKKAGIKRLFSIEV
jgi:hypothetical protein